MRRNFECITIMNKRTIAYTVFFIVLLALFFVFLFADNDNWKTKSPVLSYVKPFTFINQDSSIFTEEDMRNKVVVVNYFFTTCKGICPKMNGNMREVYETFKDEKDFMIISHTSDPETDSPAKLKKYADSMQVNTKKWVFLTGRKDSLYVAARNSYLLDDPKNNVADINDQFLHTQFFALVDKEGNVRGHIYDGLKKEEIAELKDEILELLQDDNSK